MLQTVLGFDAATIASAFLVVAGRDGPAAGAREDARSARPASRFACPSASELRRAARRGARGDLRRLRRGLDRPRRHRRRAAAISPTRRSGSAGSSPRCCPSEPEALGLLALMLHAEARRARAARRGAATTCRSAEQDPALWDAPMIDEAEALLSRASALRRDRPLPARGRGAVGARGAPPHAAAPTGRRSLAALRRAARAHRLAGRRDQPRGRAGARARGAAAGLAALDALAARRAPRRLPALLGGARRAACARRACRCARGVRACDRPRARPGGAPLPATATAAL